MGGGSVVERELEREKTVGVRLSQAPREEVTAMQTAAYQWAPPYVYRRPCIATSQVIKGMRDSVQQQASSLLDRLTTSKHRVVAAAVFPATSKCLNARHGLTVG